MPRVLLFNKPCGVLCQFSPTAGKRTLKDFIPVANVYPAGRLDADSEGLVVLTDDGKLQQAISDPKMKLSKTYWVQVEGELDEAALRQLRSGVTSATSSRVRQAQGASTSRPAYGRGFPRSASARASR